jgi:hypothetical protein
MNRRLRPTCLMWAVCALTLLLAAPQARAEIQPLPSDQPAYGLTRAEWLQAWVEWWGSLPASAHPFPDVDTKAVRTGIGQHGPVWFVAPGPFYNHAHTVIVPDGKAVLVGVLISTAQNVPGEETEASILQRASGHLERLLKQFRRLEASVDGVPIADVKQYRTRTPVFTINPPPGNVWEHPVTAGKDGRIVIAADGITLLFPPLPVGTHVVSLEGEGVGGNGIGVTGNPFRIKATYNLRVQKPSEPLQ